MKLTILVDTSSVIITLNVICLIHAPMYTKRIEETLHFHYMSMSRHKNPCPGVHLIYNFGRLFLGHHYYILNLSDPYPSVYKKRRRKMHFQYTCMTYMTTPLHKNPFAGGQETLVDPSLVIHSNVLSLSRTRVEKKIF